MKDKITVGELRRFKYKKTVPFEYKNKHLMILDGPIQTSNWDSHSLWRRHETIYKTYVVEDAKYVDLNVLFLSEFTKVAEPVKPRIEQR